MAVSGQTIKSGCSFEALRVSTPLREKLYEDLDIPMVLSPGPDTPARTGELSEAVGHLRDDVDRRYLNQLKALLNEEQVEEIKAFKERTGCPVLVKPALTTPMSCQSVA